MTPEPAPKTQIQFNCVGCGRLFKVDANLKGRKIRCSQCKRLSVIPAVSSVTSPTPAAVPKAAEPAMTTETPEPTQPPILRPPAAPRPLQIKLKPTADAGPKPIDTPVAPPPVESKPAENAPVSTPALPPETTASSETSASLHKKLQDLENTLAHLTAERSREELTYSRTITALTKQLDGIMHERDHARTDLESLRDQQRLLEQQAQETEIAATAFFQTVKEAVDRFCNTQLAAMQELRQQIANLAG